MAFKLQIDIPVILLFFANMLSSTVTTNLILYRTCYVSLNYNESECALLGKDYSSNTTKELETLVQPHATKILMSSVIISAILPPIMCFFFGPWTDVYGRKPLLLTTLAGSILTYVTTMILSIIPRLSPWFFLIPLIPNCLSGGIPAFVTAVLCYVTDVTSEANRGLRMAMVEGFVALGSILGTSASSFVLNSYGYFAVYATASLCALSAYIYTATSIPESVQNVTTEGRFKNFFNISLLKSTFQTVFKKREHYERTLILTTIALMTILVFTNFGDTAVLYLYLRVSFQWTLQKFSLYTSIISGAGIMGGITGVYLLHKILHIREIIIILIGCVSALFSSLFQGLANLSWQIYAAGCIKCLSGSVSPMSRCFLSKLIPVEESGKIFAVLTSFETIGGLAGTFIYTFIYNSTLTTYPATFNFVSFGLFAVELVLVGVIFTAQRYQKQMAYRWFDNDVISVNS